MTILQSYKYRKACVLFSLVSVCVILLFSALFTSVHADDDDTDTFGSGSRLKQNYEAYKDAIVEEIENPLLTRVQRIYGSKSQSESWFTSIFSSSVSGRVIDQVDNDSETLVTSIRSKMALFGLVWFVISLLTRLINDSMRTELTLHMLVRYAAMFIIGGLLIVNVRTIIDMVDDLGASIINWIANLTTDAGDISNKFADMINAFFAYGDHEVADATIEAMQAENTLSTFGINLLEVMVGTLTGTMPILTAANVGIEGAALWLMLLTGIKYVGLTILFLMVEIPLISVDVALYSIWIEKIIRSAFLPFAIGNIFSQGGRSSGMAAILKFLAQYIRIALCFVIAVVATSLLNAILNSFVTDGVTLVQLVLQVLAVLALYVASGKMMQTTASLANQFLGV